MSRGGWLEDEVPFVIANRWPGVSPADVPEWPDELVQDALDRIIAEGRAASRG